jgi:hypothetical protein
MSWIAITEAKLLTRVSGSELTALRAAALGVGQADPVAETISQTVNAVRRFVAGNAANILSADATLIPDSLLGAALDEIVLNLMKRPASTIIDDEAHTRKSAGESATKLFRTEPPHGYLYESGDASGGHVADWDSETKIDL